MPVLPATVRYVLAAAARQIDTIDAELLLLHVLQKPRAWLFSHDKDALAPEEFAAYEALVERRLRGEPVAYITGRRGFWTLDLEVTPATLIPRPETELLVELALARLPGDQPTTVADLGTGSGAIALAIAMERRLAQVIAVDISADALAVARRNAAGHGIGNVEFRQGSWFEPLGGERFDLIASNPPYVAVDDPHLQQGDLRFEPAIALSSGDVDGLDDIRHLVERSPLHLNDDGWLLLEHGHMQGDAVCGLLSARGYLDVECARDLEERQRCSMGRWPGVERGRQPR